MANDAAFDWFFFAGAFLWIALWIAASIVYRKRAGKPVLPRLPENVLFSERSASGPFASNCLLVAVTNDVLFISPKFPFNLMFLPEIYGLEHQISVREITDVTTSGSWFGNNLIVSYGRTDPRKLRLRLRDPEDAIEALERARLRR